MKESDKNPEQIWEELCSEAVGNFDIPIHDDLPLPMILVQGWFYDQSKCFEVLRGGLTVREQNQLFASEKHLESVKVKCERLWEKLDKNTVRGWGPHRHQWVMKYTHFCSWAERVFEKVAEVGDLKVMLNQLGTVEKAHDEFKKFNRSGQHSVRMLSAADIARLLARHGYLEPEKRPLLARGGLRGAAILLRGESPRYTTDALERKYNQDKRKELEQEAAHYIHTTEELARFGKWKMEKGESIFCQLQKQPGLRTRSKGK